MDSTILTLAGFDARPPAIFSTSRLEMEQVLLRSFRSSGVKGSSEDLGQEEFCVAGDSDEEGVGVGDGECVGDGDGDGEEVVDGGVGDVGVSEVV